MGRPGREGRPKALPSGRKGSSSARNVEPHNHGEWMRQIGWTWDYGQQQLFPGNWWVVELIGFVNVMIILIIMTPYKLI